MNYYESAEGITISKERAKRKLQSMALAGLNLQKTAANMTPMMLRLF